MMLQQFISTFLHLTLFSTSLSESSNPKSVHSFIPSEHMAFIQRRIHVDDVASTLMRHCVDLFNVIVFIRATDHVITMLCHVAKNYGWQKHFRFH